MLTRNEAHKLYELQYNKIFAVRKEIAALLQAKISQSDIQLIDEKLFQLNKDVPQIMASNFIAKKRKQTKKPD